MSAGGLRGPRGYENSLKALADPEDEEHDMMVDWIGGEFDAEYFDLVEINKALRKRFKRASGK